MRIALATDHRGRTAHCRQARHHPTARADRRRQAVPRCLHPEGDPVIRLRDLAALALIVASPFLIWGAAIPLSGGGL